MEPPEDIRALPKEEHRDELARRLQLARTHSRSASVALPEEEVDNATGLLATAFAQQSVYNPETHYQPVTDFQDKPEMGAAGASRPFTSPHQRFVVFTVSHLGMPPRVTVPTDARLRLYGVFADEAEARAYAGEVMAADETVNILVAPTQQWIVAVSHLEKLTPEYMDPKLEAMLRDHEATLESEEASFRRRLRGQQEEEEEEEAPADEQCEAAAAPPPPGAPVRFPRHLEIREQGYAVVSFIKDTGPPHEFAFNVWAVTETVDEASNYIRAVAGERVKDHTMFVCGLYAWLAPFAAADDVPVTHRASELNGIVRAAERSQSQVESFRRWCHESDQEAPVIDLTS